MVKTRRTVSVRSTTGISRGSGVTRSKVGKTNVFRSGSFAKSRNIGTRRNVGSEKKDFKSGLFSRSRGLSTRRSIGGRGKVKSGSIRFGNVTPGHSPIMGTSAKTLFVLFIYMVLLSTTTFVFQSAYADYSEFEVGVVGVISSDRNDGIDYGMPESHFGHNYEDSIVMSDIDRDRLESRRVQMETEHGGVPVPVESAYVYDWYMYPDGHMIYVDEYNELYGFDEKQTWLDGVTQFFGTIIDTFAYMINFLTFNFQAGVPLPFVISWLPFLMAVPVWIYIGLLVAPYAIEALKAISQLLDAFIPFT